MASPQDDPFAHYPFAPVLDGLHLRTDWEIPSPTAAQSCMAQSDPPPPYTPACHGSCHEAHEVQCQQRFASLKAQFDDMNGYCQHSQCTWCKAKSFFKRALSSRSRKKAMQAPEKGQPPPEPEVELSFSETQPSSPIEKPPVAFPPAELFGHEFVRDFETAELPAEASYPAQNPTPFSQQDPYQYHSNPYGHFPGWNGAVYPTNTAVQQPVIDHFQVQAQHAHELAAARSPRLTLDTTTPYADVPQRHFSGVSLMSNYVPFTTNRHPFISPNSSISSISTTAAPVMTALEQDPLLFANQTTSSPVEYAPANGNDVDWYSRAALAHDNSWDSVTTAVELPGSSPVAELADTEWQQHDPVPEPTPIPVSAGPIPLVYSNFGAIPTVASMAPTMENVMGAQFNQDPRIWPNTQAMHSEAGTRMSTWPPLQFQTTLRRQRRNSWDSMASTVLDVPVAEHHDAVPAPADYSPVSPAYMTLPSQQRQKQQQHHHHRQRRPTDRRPQPKRSKPSFSSLSNLPTQVVSPPPPPQQQRPPAPTPNHTLPQPPLPPPAPSSPNALCCVTCHYFPDKGPDQRKKVARHLLTDLHLRNVAAAAAAAAGEDDRNDLPRATGPPPPPKPKPFPCPVAGCPSAFNRADNMWQHAKRKHDVVRTRGTRRLVLRGAGGVEQEVPLPLGLGSPLPLQVAWGAGVVGLGG